MNRIAVLAAFIALLAQGTVRLTLGQTSSKRLFLLHDDQRKEWCAYSNESSWKSQVDSTGAATVATMDFSNGHLASIDLTTEDEAGDWMVFDHYTISAAGEPEILLRKSNILPGDRSVILTYLIQDGKDKLQKRVTTSLTTGEKLAGAEDWLPRVPVITRLADFPFGSLATAKYADVLSKGKICTPARTSTSRGAPPAR